MKSQEHLAKRLQPKGDKEPMKCNAFELCRIAGTTLTPMFPYLRAGEIVPAISVFHGIEGGHWGFFEHFNTVDEIIFSLGSIKGGLIRSGEITSGARTHGVTAPVTDHGDPEAGMIMGVIQRQDEDAHAGQMEGIVFRCSECNEELFRHEFEGRDNVTAGRAPSDEFFSSPYAAGDAARIFNADETLRICPKCGHHNAPFPIAPWGWDRYQRQTNLAREAKRSLMDAAAKSAQRRRPVASA